MISPLSEGFALIRLSRTRLNSSSAERLVVICPDVVVDVDVGEGEVEEFPGEGPVFESAGGVICATDPRFDHQYQPPIPSPPTKRRMNSPRIPPCHHRNCEGVSGSP